MQILKSAKTHPYPTTGSGIFSRTNCPGVPEQPFVKVLEIFPYYLGYNSVILVSAQHD